MEKKKSRRDFLKSIGFAGVGGILRKLTAFNSAISTPSSIVGEQNNIGNLPSRKRFSLSILSSYWTCAVCSLASNPWPTSAIDL